MGAGQSDANQHNAAGRLATVAASDDSDIYDGQVFIFYVYYLSLILAVALKFVSLSIPDFYAHSWGKYLIFTFTFISTFSLLWSSTLPSLLRSIASSRTSNLIIIDGFPALR